MDKQYSVEFFVSFIDAMQKLCRDYLHFEQGVELSGYLALEIDNIKKERYVLSEFVQSTGQVISESYCTKAFKTVKKLPEKNTDVENIAPAKMSNSRWGQRQSVDTMVNRYRKSTSSQPSSSLHGRTHTITSASLEELTEFETSHEQSTKWPTHTASPCRGTKRSTMDSLVGSPNNKKEKVDANYVMSLAAESFCEEPRATADLSDKIAMPLPDSVVIKDETDTFVDSGGTSIQIPTEESSDQQSTNTGNTSEQSVNNFQANSTLNTSDETVTDTDFKNSQGDGQSKVSDILPDASGSVSKNSDCILDEKGSTMESGADDMALKIDFQMPGSSISPLSYQSFMNSQFRDVKMHKCQHCDFRTEYQGNLKRHMRVHTGEFFHCSLCPRHFSDKYELSIHMQLHTGTITCRYCGEEFTSKNRRWEHERQHKRDLPQM